MALPVLIIGSGLGGLNLAQSLQKYQIPYRIFERDSQQEQRQQGYRISLDGGGTGGADALRATLTPELFEKFEQTCGAQHRPGGRVDGPSGKLLQAGVLGLIGTGGWEMVWLLASRYLGKRWEKMTWENWKAWLWSWAVRPAPSTTALSIPPGADKSYQVDRRMLRSILLTSQSPHITYDSALTSYTLSPDDDFVTAHFSNGNSVKGSLIVGADGIRSRVASQLVGDVAQPIDLGLRVIYGKTPLAPDVEKTLHPVLQKGVSFVTDGSPEKGKITLVMETMRFRHSEAPENYIFWALCIRSELFDAQKGDRSESPDVLSNVTSQLTDHWDPRIKIIFEKLNPSNIAALPIRSSNPDSTVEWKTERRVTVLGDAVHCMPPTGGQGGNAALYDAALLGLALSREDGREIGWSVETIQAYEQAMRYNIGDIVGMACIGASKALGGTMPPIGT